MSRSFAAKLLAVKRVSENKGKRTPGVDERLLDTAKKKWQVFALNQPGYHSQPLRRVHIPKKNNKKRPLGIPTMRTRAEQALELQGLDPVSECLADNHSYGFRKMRSTQDAMAACYNALRRKGSAEWILEGDIKSCFDKISHEWMLDNIPMHKQKLKVWLKSGFLERNMFHPTEEGIPQGGIISPTAANMALDGMEDLLKSNFRRQDKIHFVRYADDFTIRGWANYYRHVVSSEIFGKIDHAIWRATWKWSKRRHPKKPLRWIKKKYFHREGHRDWIFGEKESAEKLFRMGQIPIRRHVKIKADANPYDPRWNDYFAKRSKPKSTGFLAELYQCLSSVR